MIAGKAFTVNQSGENLTVLNPFARYAHFRLPPQTLDISAVLTSPEATEFVADGKTAVVLLLRAKSAAPATFALSSSAEGLPGGTAVGSLGIFDENYLVDPNPPANQLQTYTAPTPFQGPFADGTYIFLALLWAPNALPSGLHFPSVDISVTAAQSGTVLAQRSIALIPPPLLLAHGVWSSAKEAHFTQGAGGFYDWIQPHYPHSLIYAVDYEPHNYKEFADPEIQKTLLEAMSNALAAAAKQGVAARRVDVVGHSMGGLLTRFFLSIDGYLGNPALLKDPVHKLITIGTPHRGSELAATLVREQGRTPLIHPPLLKALCQGPGCTLGQVMGAMGKRVDTAAESLSPNSDSLIALSSENRFAAIIGIAPPGNLIESVLNILINAFLPGRTVGGILSNELHDTIVPLSSQRPGGIEQTDNWIVLGIVHAALPVFDTGETASPEVWAKAYHWLTGITSTASFSADSKAASKSAAIASPPALDLSGYTEVPASNVAFLPTTGSNLIIHSANEISATSLTKTLTQVLLVQTVVDPADPLLLCSTEAPFSISFTPTRLGSASFAAIAVFSDNTYAMTTLSYQLQPSGTPYWLTLVNAPEASVTVGSSQVIKAVAQFEGGPVDVSSVATFVTRSGSSSVFSVSPTGAVTANGNGVDYLDVNYGGLTETAQIPVGVCNYTLNPSNQIVPHTGGTVSIQVSTQAGCAWTATGGDAWLPFTNVNGSGNGVITLTAASNSSGLPRDTNVALGDLDVFVTQPPSACTYGLSQAQVSAPSAGASGAISVTTSCSVIAASNQPWLTGEPLGSTVVYNVEPNNTTSQRSATLTIGTQSVSFVQSGTAIPTAPILVSPNEGATGVLIAASLNWNASLEPTAYDVYFGASPTPPLVTTTTSSSYSPGALAPGTNYYWQVVAKNIVGAATSPVWSFTTTQVLPLEADVAPRPTGSGNIVVSDWVQVGRFSVGLDIPVPGSEFQKADCAPRSTLGDGLITVADWVQAGRYSVGLDQAVAAGGATNLPAGAQPVFNGTVAREIAPRTQGSVVRAVNGEFKQGEIGALLIEIDAVGDENALGFTFSFDPSKATFLDAVVSGKRNGDAAVMVNATQVSEGHVGIAIALPSGKAFQAGRQGLLALRFLPLGGDGATGMPVRFDDTLIGREIVVVDARRLSQPVFRDATVTIRRPRVRGVSPIRQIR